MEQPAQPSSTRFYSRAWFLITSLIILVLLGATLLYFFVIKDGGRTLVPEYIRQYQSQVSFPLYYPKKLTGGFLYDQSALDPATQVVTYSIKDGEKKVFFSLQAKPSNFNFDEFNKKMSNARTVNTPVGPATIGILEKQTVCSVVAPDAWILTSAGTGVSIDELEKLCTTLQKT